MTKLFKSIPLPIAGLMLGLAGLGNLVGSYGGHYRIIAGIMAGLIALLLIGRILTDYSNVSKELKHPILGSVALCFPMGLMILSTYILSWSAQLALSTWYLGLALHILLLIKFSLNLFEELDIKKVFPSYFIVYVGIVVGSVTAPAFNHIQLGQYLFYFGFISYLILLPIILYRVVKVKNIKNPALPTITIFTAPAGLCLAGYMNVFPQKNIMFLGCLVTITLISVLSVILYLPKMISVGFFPSFSAFTFPFVITTIGLKLSTNFLISNYSVNFLNYPVKILEILSISLVLFVTVKYGNYLLKNVRNVVK